MARVCGRVCAHVFTLPEIRSFLELPSLHPEVFADPSNQLNKSNRAEWASDGSALACGAEHRVGGRPRWRLWLPAAGCRLPVTRRLLAAPPPPRGGHRRGLRDTRHRPRATVGGHSLQNSNGSEKRITTKY